MMSFSVVPRAGIEPARIASLVFETNASTNSATWAYSLWNDANIGTLLYFPKIKLLPSLN